MQTHPSEQLRIIMQIDKWWHPIQVECFDIYKRKGMPMANAFLSKVRSSFTKSRTFPKIGEYYVFVCGQTEEKDKKHFVPYFMGFLVVRLPPPSVNIFCTLTFDSFVMQQFILKLRYQTTTMVLVCTETDLQHSFLLSFCTIG